MAELRSEKFVNTLPVTLVANTIYYVKNGAVVDVYVTNDTGTIIAYPLNVPNNLDYVDLTTNQTVGGTKTVTGDLLLKGGNAFRVENLAGGVPSGSSGDGFEILNVGGFTKFQAYNRTTGQYIPMNFESSNNVFYGANNFNVGVKIGSLLPAQQALDVAFNATIAGDLGIGVVNPTAKLDVDGTIKGKGLNIYAPASTTYGEFNSTSNGFGYLTFKHLNVPVGYIGAGDGVIIGGSAADFGFQALNNFVITAGGPTERFRVATNGDIKIPKLASGLTAPTTSGTTKMVTTDANGLLSFANIPSGSGSIPTLTEIEVDFGTKPVNNKTFTVTDATVISTNKIIFTPSPNNATGQIGNDWEVDSATFSAKANTGNITLYVNAQFSMNGRRKLYYQILN